MAADRVKEASESVLRAVDQGINVFDPIEAWVSGELIFFHQEDGR